MGVLCIIMNGQVWKVSTRCMKYSDLMIKTLGPKYSNQESVVADAKPQATSIIQSCSRIVILF